MVARVLCRIFGVLVSLLILRVIKLGFRDI
jgi:hypothetical protein